MFAGDQLVKNEWLENHHMQNYALRSALASPVHSKEDASHARTWSMTSNQQWTTEGRIPAPKLVALQERKGVDDSQAVPTTRDREGEPRLHANDAVLVTDEGAGVQKGQAVRVTRHPHVVKNDLVPLPWPNLRESNPPTRPSDL